MASLKRMIVWLQLLSTPGTLVLAIANPILLTFVTVLNGALSLSYLGMTGKHSFKLLSRPASGLLAFALVFLLLHSFLIKTEDGGPFFVGRMFVLLLCAYFPILEWGKLDEETKHRMRLLFFGGMFLAGVYFFFKILFNHWDQKLFMSFTGIVKEMKAHYGNRPAVIFVLWIWPVLLGFRLLLLPKSRWIYGSVTLLFLMFVIGGILQTASETAKLALLAGSLVFVIARLSLVWVRRLLGVGIVAVLILAPILFHGVYKKYNEEYDFLPFSAEHRLVIWSYTSELIWQKPILGHGLRIAHSDDLVDLNEQGEETVLELKPRKMVVRAINQHPHNMVLQIWLEFGAIGISFAIALTLMFFRFLGRLNHPLQSYALATVASFATVGFVGYGLWQSWLLVGALWAVIAFAMLSDLKNSVGKKPG